jgi:hypothetical protein
MSAGDREPHGRAGLEPSGRGTRGGRDEPPLGSWTRLYALVIAVFVGDVLLLWLLTRAFE